MSLVIEPAPDPATPSPIRSRWAASWSEKHRGAALLLKRAGIYLLTFVGAATVNFIIPRIMPGDPLQQVVQSLQAKTGQPLPQPTIDSIAGVIGGSDDNVLQQYLGYWGQLFRGDLGLSASHYPSKVSDLIGTALPWTIGLVVVSLAVAWVVGVGLGMIAGWFRGRAVDIVLALVCSAMISIPSFWAALMVQYVIAYKFGWLPADGAADPNLVPAFSPGFVWSVLEHALLPGLTIALISFAGFFFTMRNMMTMSVTDDYVLLGKAKGLSARRVMIGYAARNAILPSVAGFAQAIGGSIGGVLIIETIFTYPGIGSLMTSGISSFDFPLIQGCFLVVMIAVLVMNFVADSIYVLIDPRTREETE